MKKTADTSKFVVYDDVLSEEDFEKVWTYLNKGEYSTVHHMGWQKVWQPNDGTPLVGKENFQHRNAPFNCEMDIVHKQIFRIAQKHSDIVEGWEEFTLRSYIYPRGTKLSWHNDGAYKGAAIFYAHPTWSAEWGGELLMAEIPKSAHGLAKDEPLDPRHRDKMLGEWGMGQYVTPNPNRIVMTHGDVWHSLARIDDDAGDNCRCSVVCFFV